MGRIYTGLVDTAAVALGMGVCLWGWQHRAEARFWRLVSDGMAEDCRNFGLRLCDIGRKTAGVG